MTINNNKAAKDNDGTEQEHTEVFRNHVSEK